MKRNATCADRYHGGPPRARRCNVTRQTFLDVLLIIGLLVAGGLCGVGARMWIGGLRQQHAQLERCVLDSKHTHPSEDARSTLAHLDAEVPACMNAAGYEAALNDQRCSPAFWQGDVFCYVPKGSLGKVIYRIEAASAEKRMKKEGSKESSGGEG